MKEKLFEIPVYAFSKDELEKRVRKKRDQLNRKYNDLYPGLDKSRALKMMSEEIGLKDVWEYNHIVGYITISLEQNDIFFDYYTEQFRERSRYRWDTSRKHFFVNTYWLGLHFSIVGMNDSEEVRLSLREMIDIIVKDLKEQGLYVDLEAFNNIESLIDYSRLLNGEEYGKNEI